MERSKSHDTKITSSKRLSLKPTLTTPLLHHGPVLFIVLI